MELRIITITNGGFASEITDVNRGDRITFRLDPGRPGVGPGRTRPADVTWPAGLFSNEERNPLPVTAESTPTVAVAGTAKEGPNQISADDVGIKGWIKVGS